MSNLARVRRVSAIMKFCCTLAIPLVPLSLAVMWGTFDMWAASHPELAHLRPLPDPMPGTSLAIGFAISMIPGGLVMFAAWRLRSLFRSYADGRVFTGGTARCLRDFALSIILLAVAKPVATTLLSVTLTFTNPPGQRMLSLQLGSADLTTLFIGCVFLVIAWIMEEARKIAEEQAQII